MSEIKTGRIDAAAAAHLMRLTGKPTLDEAIAEALVWRESHETLQREKAEHAVLVATAEDQERKALVAQLTSLGASVVPALAAMPIADLRAYVSDWRKANRK